MEAKQEVGWASKQLKLVTTEIRSLPAWVQNCLPRTVKK